MASELANLVQLYIEGCENCCSVSIIDLERMQRGIEALETDLADAIKDKERLDFVEQELEVNAGTQDGMMDSRKPLTGWWFSDCYFPGTLREAIDAALALPEDEGGRVGNKRGDE
jgi:hypothetical protein